MTKIPTGGDSPAVSEKVWRRDGLHLCLMAAKVDEFAPMQPARKGSLARTVGGNPPDVSLPRYWLVC